MAIKLESVVGPWLFMKADLPAWMARAILVLAVVAIAVDLAWQGIHARLALGGGASTPTGDDPRMILSAFIPVALLAVAALGRLGWRGGRVPG